MPKIILIITQFILCFILPIIVPFMFTKLIGIKDLSTASIVTALISSPTTLAIYLLVIRKKSLSFLIENARQSLLLFALLFIVLSTLTILIFTFVTPPSVVRFDNLTFSLLLASFAFSLNSALYEELFFRDMIFRWSVMRYPLFIALLIQIFTFGASHFFTVKFNALSSVSLLIATLLYSLLWLYTKSFVASLSAHFTWNFSLGIADGYNNPLLIKPGLILGEGTLERIIAHRSIEVVALIIVCWLLYSKREAIYVKLNKVMFSSQTDPDLPSKFNSP